MLHVGVVQPSDTDVSAACGHMYFQSMSAGEFAKFLPVELRMKKYVSPVRVFPFAYGYHLLSGEMLTIVFCNDHIACCTDQGGRGIRIDFIANWSRGGASIFRISLK